jgi:hypothetical protein
MNYHIECDRFVEEQRSKSKGQRLEMLGRDLIGEKKLLSEVLLPVLQSANGLEMEHEMISLTGIKIYGDIFYRNLGMVFECDGFAVHAENITRDRFSFERMRIQTMAMYGYRYIPFSKDDLDKKPEACRRVVYGLLGRYSTHNGDAFMQLSVYEREILRYALRLGREIRTEDVSYCLQLGEDTSRRVLKSLMNIDLIKPRVSGAQRVHAYMLTEKARDFLLM